MNVLVLLSFLALFSWSHGSDQLDFKQWSSVYLPDATQERLDAIYPTWKKNAELVSEHNQENSQFTMTFNKFAHLTPDQVPKISPRFAHSFESKANKFTENALSPPKSFDWRDHNAITPVHNQEEMGCSDPLVLSDAISSLHAIISKDLVQFSYRQLLDCCWHCNCSGLVHTGNGCSPGLNLCPESLYPTRPSSKCLCFNEDKCTFQVKGAMDVVREESALQSAILISPIMAAIDVPVSMQAYRSGIFSSKNCSSTQLNHMILVVGYGENDSGEKYWICKNSWGVDWGMNGYFLLAKDQDNMCGIATQASYLLA